MNSPKDIVNMIIEKGWEADFLTSIQLHKGGFSIGEIGDKKFLYREDGLHFVSPGYKINVVITDDDILTAVHNGLYVTAFISRRDDSFNVHFLVHQYPETMKDRFEEEIAGEVVRYMIVNTVIALRLDTEEKVKKYIGA